MDMYRLKIILIASVSFIFIGCLENQEKIEIRADGSGTFVNNITLDSKIDTQQLFPEQKSNSKNVMDKTIDTTFFVKEIVDADSNLGEAKKELYSKGKVQIKINKDKNIYRMTISIPFSSLDNLQAIMQDIQISAASEKKFRDLLLNENDESAISEADKIPGLSDVNSVYDITIKNGLISRKLNQERYKEKLREPGIARLQQMASAGIQIINTIVINLPEPATKTGNSNMQVSDDGKTIGMRYNLMDLFSKPGQFDYTIEY